MPAVTSGVLDAIRSLFRELVLYGLVGGGVVFAGLLGLHAQFQPLSIRGFLFFATLGCLVVGSAPLLLVGPRVHDVPRVRGGEGHPDSTVVADGSSNPRTRYKVGLPPLTAGAYAFAAFLLLGST